MPDLHSLIGTFLLSLAVVTVVGEWKERRVRKQAE